MAVPGRPAPAQDPQRNRPTMTFALKPLRLLLATGASVLAFGGGTALAAPSPVGTPDPLDVQAPDCVTTCTKTLQPGQRLVVAGRYAFQSATINGTASGFGARFAVKRSPDGTTYSKLYESPFMT